MGIIKKITRKYYNNNAHGAATNLYLGEAEYEQLAGEIQAHLNEPAVGGLETFMNMKIIRVKEKNHLFLG